MKKMRELLRDETSPAPGATEAAFGFSNTEEFPGGIRPIGRYSVEGEKVTVMLRLRRDGVEIAKAQVIGTKDDIAAKLIAAIKAAIKKF
jgi:hypothetical protein